MTCKGWLEITMENNLVKSRWTLNTNSASCLNKKHVSQALCILQYIFKLENVSMRIKDQVTMTLMYMCFELNGQLYSCKPIWYINGQSYDI
jgi:hypothetical protein